MSGKISGKTLREVFEENFEKTLRNEREILEKGVITITSVAPEVEKTRGQELYFKGRQCMAKRPELLLPKAEDLCRLGLYFDGTQLRKELRMRYPFVIGSGHLDPGRIGLRDPWVLLSLLFSSVLLGAPSQVMAKKTPLARARKLLKKHPLIDGHNDLPWTLREKAQSDVHHWNLGEKSPTDTDIPRLRQGGVGAQFWSVYIPVGEKIKKQGYAKTQLEQIELAHRMIEAYPESLSLARSVRDIEKAQSRGKIASLLGIEGGHAIENSLGALRAYYRLGVRYMTLTHYKNIDWADSATDKEVLGGLSPFGEKVVHEMNQLGMMIDLSHVSAKVMHRVLDISQAPVIFSHSSARALTPHNRNVPDDVLKRVAKNRGVVMVTFVTGFVSSEVKAWWDNKEVGPRPQAFLNQVADHIDHVKKVAGVQSVGIGGDYYGQDHVVTGLEDVSKYPHLFAELIRRGWTEDELALLARGNILRVFRQVEAVARELQRAQRKTKKEKNKSAF